MSRSAAVRTPKAPAPALVTLSADALDEVMRRWIELRAQRVIEPTDFTTCAALQQDFTAWLEAEFPDVVPPADAAFLTALRTAYKIRIENLPARTGWADTQRKVALCANLKLLPGARGRA